MAGNIIALLLIAIIAYLWGSIPSGYWMGKLLRGKDFDIRDYGSHRTGATNVLRTLGKIPALIVFIVDLSKGIGPALITTFVSALFVGGWGPAIAGTAAFFGHCYPLFIGFKGGRGVLTGAGALLVISPVAFLISAITTMITIGISRYVSLGSIVGCLTVLICGIVFYVMRVINPASAIFMVLVPILIILLHSDNIKRLLAGQERKIGQKEVISTPTSNSSNVSQV